MRAHILNFGLAALVVTFVEIDPRPIDYLWSLMQPVVVAPTPDPCFMPEIERPLPCVLEA